MAILGGLAMAGLYGVVVDFVNRRAAERMPQLEAETRPLIEVRNGCGETGLAARVKERLLDCGFDVIHTGNADDFRYRYSILVDLKGNPSGLANVRSVLNCESVVLQREADAIAEYALIVGQDYREMRWLK
jgi:hypothetical protein